MGVTYRLKLEINNYILEIKRANPVLSCRRIVALIENKFQTKVSKSSINTIIKESGLSMPVGRRRKKRRAELKLEGVISAQPKELALLVELAQPVAVQPISPQEQVQAKPEEGIKEVAKIKAEEPRQIQPEYVQTELEEFVQSEGFIEGLGAILLKAADFLLGGTNFITEVIKNRLKREEQTLLAKTECLLYGSLFNLTAESELKPDCGLWTLINRRFVHTAIFNYLNALKEVIDLPLDILRAITSVLQEVRGIKISLLETNFYLDGQLHTIWSTPQIPYDFSVTIYNIKSYIKKSLQEAAPLVLFMAPGYEMPTKEFFDFIFDLNAPERREALKLTLYGHKFEELAVMRPEQLKPPFFVFGLWPWQFIEYRKVKSIGEYKPFYFEPLEKNFFLAAVEIELLQPNVNKGVTLRGCTLKNSPNDKVRLIILSNLPAERASFEELVNIYLSHWPNLEETFQDFSRKIELFTYTASSQHYFSTEKLDLKEEAAYDLNIIFDYYLKVLDLYVRWHFLPSGYEDSNFSTIKEQFYALSGRLKRQKDYLLVTFSPPSGYKFLKDLEYACRRINEREIIFNDGSRLWCSTA